ncbi:MAG: hypothetical protein M3O30_18090 [Planctomycetota bacterium]|nr:hypothetical protein [Planctomycetota bacterium]
MRVLVLGSTFARFPEKHLRPIGFCDFQNDLQKSGRVELEIRADLALGEFESTLALAQADVAFLVISWDQPMAEVGALLWRLRKLRPKLPMVLVDQSDQTASPFLEFLPQIDLLVKSQTLRDRSGYVSSSQTGYVFTDFLTQKLGYDVGDWHFGASADSKMTDKIVTGWNIGATRRLRAMLALNRWLFIPWKLRRCNFHCRVMPGPSESPTWYTRYRQFAADSLIRAAAPYRCTGNARIDRRKYLWEMANSRIVFSPFGWGEVCHRDFEAVALGCLLLKPSMEHVATEPNIFVDHHTYVPVKWDLSDLESVCHWCMENPRQCQRIAANARKALREYLARDGFTSHVRDVLTRAQNNANSRISEI